MKSKSIKELIIKNAAYVIEIIILIYLFSQNDVFVKIFIKFNPQYDNPNAGSGFGVLLFFALNTIIFFCCTLANILSSTNSKK